MWIFAGTRNITGYTKNQLLWDKIRYFWRRTPPGIWPRGISAPQLLHEILQIYPPAVGSYIYITNMIFKGAIPIK